MPTTREIFSTQPFVRVGNIIGDRLDSETATAVFDYTGNDTVERNFVIDPTAVYHGEANKAFKITFAANGPMYAVTAAADGETVYASIAVTIPGELLPITAQVGDEDGVGGEVGDDADLDAYIQNHIRISQSGRVKLRPSTNLFPNPVIANGEGADKTVTIDLDRIDKGAKVILTYTFEGAPDYAGATIGDETETLTVDGVVKEVSGFVIETTVPVRDGTIDSGDSCCGNIGCRW